MSNLDLIISVSIFIAIVAIVFAIKFYISNSKLTFENSNLLQKLSNLQDIADKNTALEIQNATLNANLQNQIQINAQNKEFFDKELKDKINLISEQMLNLNAEKITKSSENLVENLLQTQIKPLKNEIEKYQKANVELNTVFRENFENLKVQSQNILNEANKLTNALKNDKKAIGNWGEMQLDLVLNSSGLELGKNYQKQAFFVDNDGNRRFVDVLVDFGNGKKAVIDSKCPLIHYVEYFNTQNQDEAKNLIKALINDIKRHIDELSDKNYAKFDSNTYDFVFMFIPNDNILNTALSNEPSLYQYAYEKNIFLTTPLTLLMAMKTVHLCWQNIKIDQNALKILIAAGKIYDKFAVFLDSFEKIGNNISTINTSYETAQNQLLKGKGNICKQLENFKELGAKTNKIIKVEQDEQMPLLESANLKTPILENDENLAVLEDKK